ncbi:hypothetical protein [Nocardia brasiliensis]|uniref:hypothetical protein n=1 Tax=Nocardia brasiliensis TaxID=37326 RepID=UPI002456112E|nr:hypothetical protein [Nocardia brasiliensis]
MKTSELIQQLQDAVREHGDIDVRIYSRARGEFEVDRVEHNENDDSPAISVTADN